MISNPQSRSLHDSACRLGGICRNRISEYDCIMTELSGTDVHEYCVLNRLLSRHSPSHYPCMASTASAMSTLEQSMQCCNSVRCHSPHRHSGHHSKERRDTTPQMHVVGLQGISFSLLTLQCNPNARSLTFAAATLHDTLTISHCPPQSLERSASRSDLQVGCPARAAVLCEITIFPWRKL